LEALDAPAIVAAQLKRKPLGGRIDSRVNFSFRDIAFDGSPKLHDSWVLVTGIVATKARTRTVAFKTRQLDDGNWLVRADEVEWNASPPADQEWLPLLRQVVQRLKALLSPVSAWPGSSSEEGAQVVVNQHRPPSNLDCEIFFSNRFEIGAIPSPPWDELWPRIESRVRWDPHFRVAGISQTDVLQSLPALEGCFPADWIESVYRDSAGKQVGMSADLPRSNLHWFPARHLAATAMGAICADPAWVYLVEIGRALDTLHGLPNLSRILRHVRVGHGHRHHLCIAAELCRRSYLKALEPEDASGDNDLLVQISGRPYEVELKEVSSDMPLRKVQQRLHQKSQSIPEQPARPVLFHAVLAVRTSRDPQRDVEFHRNVRADHLTIPYNIEALVVSDCFVDADGAYVKRDLIDVRPGPNAGPNAVVDIETMFASNFDAVVYPRFGFGTYIDSNSPSTAS